MQSDSDNSRKDYSKLPPPPAPAFRRQRDTLKPGLIVNSPLLNDSGPDIPANPFTAAIDAARDFTRAMDNLKSSVDKLLPMILEIELVEDTHQTDGLL